jgi:hypothetical protein
LFPLTAKETAMLYKTMILGLLEQRPRLHNQLRQQRTLLATVEQHAKLLKARHEMWKEQLSQARPGSDPGQVASAALEIALKELEDSLPSDSPPDESEPFSLDEAMAYLRRHTPPA